MTSSRSPIRVLIADDQQMVRQGFTVLLNTKADIEVVGQAVDGLDAVAKVAEFVPDVVLMDIRMPELDGIEATRRITGATPHIKVLVLTTFDLDEYVYEALRAGASGFLLKDASADQLAEAVRVVAAGDALLAPGITRRLIDQFSRLDGRPRTPQGAGRRSDRARDGGPRTDRGGVVERGDRRAPGRRRADGEDPCGPDPGEAGPQGPHAGGGVRVRVGAGTAVRLLTAVRPLTRNLRRRPCRAVPVVPEREAEGPFSLVTTSRPPPPTVFIVTDTTQTQPTPPEPPDGAFEPYKPRSPEFRAAMDALGGLRQDLFHDAFAYRPLPRASADGRFARRLSGRMREYVTWRRTP